MWIGLAFCNFHGLTYTQLLLSTFVHSFISLFAHHCEIDSIAFLWGRQFLSSLFFLLLLSSFFLIHNIFLFLFILIKWYAFEWWKRYKSIIINWFLIKFNIEIFSFCFANFPLAVDQIKKGIPSIVSIEKKTKLVQCGCSEMYSVE